ncbi:MAG: Gfo/Idh/MocA family oxidoreductase [candidate division WOR-3 bacterium]
MIKCGVIGLGYMGEHHTRILSKLPNVSLTGVSDINEKRGKEIAKKYKCKFFLDYRELIRETDCLIIATPTLTHKELATMALKEGKHVFLEKPISFSLKEAEEIIKVAKRLNLILQVGHIERFNPALIAGEEFIKEPLFVEAYRLSPFPGRGIDVSVVLDLMIHDIDILIKKVKSPIRKISAIGIPVLTNEIDFANARIEFKNGVIANLTASRVSSSKVRKILFWQKDSYVSIDTLNKKAEIFYKRKKEGKVELEKKELKVQEEDPLFLQMKAFIEACRGERPLSILPEEAEEALIIAHKISEKIQESLRKIKIYQN